MTQAYWPSSLPQCAMPWEVSGGPQDVRASFESDVGASISRPRSTGAIDVYSCPLPALSQDQFATFAAWYGDELKSGSLAFLWRDPMSSRVRRVKIRAGESYKVQRRGRWRFVSFTASFLPGALWFTDYVVPGYSIPPTVIYDIHNATYGIENDGLGQTMRDTFVTGGSGASAFDIGAGEVMDLETFEADQGTWVLTFSNGGAETVAVMSFDASGRELRIGSIPAAQELVRAVLYPEVLPLKACTALAAEALS